MRTAAIHSGARRIYGILGTAIVVRTRGGTPVRVGVFVDVCVGVEDAHAVKPLECRGPTQYAYPSRSSHQSSRMRRDEPVLPLARVSGPDPETQNPALAGAPKPETQPPQELRNPKPSP